MTKSGNERMKGIMPPQDIPKLDEGPPVCERVREWLKAHKNAFSIQRLMIDAFGRKEKDVLGAFKDWPERQDIALYLKIRRCLDELIRDKKVSSKKVGKPVLYWWTQHGT